METKIKAQLVGAGLVAALTLATQAAYAGPAFDEGLSSLALTNAENVYRSDTACATSACLPFDANIDPVGYRRADPTVFNNIQAGDLFIGINDFQQIKSVVSGLPTYDTDSSPIDNFSGYFVQEVKSVALDVNGTTDRVLLGSATVADPFGILSVGGLDGDLSTLSDNEMFRLFVDTSTQYNTAGGLSVFDSIATATDGVLWAVLGVGETAGTALAPALDADGYMYSEVQLGGGLTDFGGDFFGSFNIIEQGAAYNAGDLNPINDSAELLFGGGQLGDPVSTLADNFFGVCAASAFYGCYDIVGNGQLEVGTSFNSPWTFSSEDPLFIHRIPEPGALSLFGLGLLGMGMSKRRRKVS